MDSHVYFNPIFQPANETRCRYRVMKGSAGSGKSVDIAQDYILKLMDKKYEGANLLVIRKIGDWNRQSTYAELVSAVWRICGRYTDMYWDIKQSPLALRCKTTHNEILFRGMKDDKQREGVKSVTFKRGKLTWIWAEEATELEESDVDILDDRMRGVLANENLYYQLTLSFNPVSITHWIKAKYFDTVNSLIFTHHSTYKNNLFIDPAYDLRMQMREKSDPEGYRVYGLGEWGLLGGQFFSVWKDSAHVVAPFKIPDTWLRFRSMDWGSAKPYSVGWYAIDYDGNAWKYRELYGYGGKANVGTKETAKQVANKIADAEKSDRNMLAYGVLDSACWADSGTTGPTIAEEINNTLLERGCKMFNPCSKGRAEMAEQMKLRLTGYEDNAGTTIPALRFFNTCFHSIRTIPNLTHDKRDPEKVDTNGEDHAYDETGYALMSRPWTPPKPEPAYHHDKWKHEEKPSVWAL
jgi:PBSX family phage terminase large subunit